MSHRLQQCHSTKESHRPWRKSVNGDRREISFLENSGGAGNFILTAIVTFMDTVYIHIVNEL